jgi:hypothetical protein
MAHLRRVTGSFEDLLPGEKQATQKSNPYDRQCPDPDIDNPCRHYTRQDSCQGYQHFVTSVGHTSHMDAFMGPLASLTEVTKCW